MRPFFFFALALGVLLSLHAQAKDYPALLSVGGGGYDFDREDTHRKSVDYRLEYRAGISLLPHIVDSFNSVEPFFQVHPSFGIEGNTKGVLYPNAGLNLDVPFLRHGIFTWGEAVGAFGQGNDARSLGSVLEFRSQFELGWRFSDDLRVTAFISHISNAGTVSDDPGAEIAGVYVHVPFSLMGAK
jgi:hypothetical protein